MAQFRSKQNSFHCNTVILLTFIICCIRCTIFLSVSCFYLLFGFGCNQQIDVSHFTVDSTLHCTTLFIICSKEKKNESIQSLEKEETRAFILHECNLFCCYEFDIKKKLK
jgi:hypothetical protein